MTADVSIAELRLLLSEVIAAQKENAERFKETNVKFQETDKKIKAAFDLFQGQWGKLIESLVEGDLINLLQQRGIQVKDTVTRRKGSTNGQNYEFDIIAHNGDEIVVVEVKTTLRIKHIKQFLKQLKQIKTLIADYKDKKIYGAIAYLKAEEASEVFAQKQQLFVIRATGDSASIINEPDFSPKVF